MGANALDRTTVTVQNHLGHMNQVVWKDVFGSNDDDLVFYVPFKII